MTWKVFAIAGESCQGKRIKGLYLSSELGGTTGQARGSATRKLRGQRGETAAGRHHRLWRTDQTCSSSKGFYVLSARI